MKEEKSSFFWSFTINDLNLAMSYMNRRYVHRVYLKKDNTLIGGFERK